MQQVQNGFCHLEALYQPCLGKDHRLKLLSKWDFVYDHFIKVHQRQDWMLLGRIAASNTVEIMATAYLQCCGILECCK